MMIDYIIFVIC
uniref:Uncharacterized protein n=1 Tax=Rhizophora mucronata TaxID=61149 RepID=A0A2P2QTH7_RHIMU